MKFKYFFTTPLLVSAISFFSFVGAHGLGQSLEQEVNGYTIDVGYSAEDKIFVGETIRFDFNLWQGSESNIVNFDHTWVRIAPDDEGVSFASFLHYPKPLLTGMSYTFEKSGQYTLTVRFLDDDDKILAEASFPLSVEEAEGTMFAISQDLIMGFVVGAIIGAGLAFLLKRKRLQTNE